MIDNPYLRLTREFNEGRTRAIICCYKRLEAMQGLMKPWRDYWPTFQRDTAGLPLKEAHPICVKAAARLLPGE